jgi:zinc protease
MTYMDWTTYFETMPADKIDLSLRLEADRMVNSLFDPQETAAERTVVISEREGSENEPLFLLSEAVQHAAFRVHPYHHEVIGDLPDLQSMSRDDLYQHYRAYYAPNNAVISVAGNFNTKNMLERICDLYEQLPVSPVPQRLSRPEPERRGEHRLTVEGPGETTYIESAYHAVTGNDPDFFILTVLDSLLCGPSSLNMFGGGGTSNKTSRLYQALVEKELAVAVHGGLVATIDPYLYSIIITVHPQSKPEQVMAAFDDEVRRIQNEPIPADEVARAVKHARALFAYGSESITNQAFWLGHAEMFATYDWFTTYLEKLAIVTAEDVQEAAQKYLRPRNRVVGTYLPTGNQESR